LKALDIVVLDICHSAVASALADAIAQLGLLIIVPILLALCADFIAFPFDTTTLLSPIGIGRGLVEDSFVLYTLRGRSPVVIVATHVVSLTSSNLIPIILVVAVLVTRIVTDIFHRGHRTEQLVIPIGVFVIIISWQLEVGVLPLDTPLQLIPYSFSSFL